MKMHYRGEIKTEGGGWLAGWAPCCTGDRAVMIRSLGQHTYDRSLVTCKSCLKQLERHDAYMAKLNAATSTPSQSK